MVQGLPSPLGRLDVNSQVFLGFVLADIFRQGLGAEGKFHVRVVFGKIRGGDAVFPVHFFPVDLRFKHSALFLPPYCMARARSPALIISSTDMAGSSLVMTAAASLWA